MLKIGVKKDHLDKLFIEAIKIEDNSNQILNFTKEVKNMNEKIKFKLLKHCGELFTLIKKRTSMKQV